MLGGRSFYAIYNNIIFEFAYKRDRDYFVSNSDAVIINSHEAYKHYKPGGFVFVNPSCALGANESRKHAICDWYERSKTIDN